MKKSRRNFIRRSAAGAAGLTLGVNSLKGSENAGTLDLKSVNPYADNGYSQVAGIMQREHWRAVKPVFGFGPASKYVPKIMAAAVRRKDNYGMWWPGEIYDGQAAIDRYAQLVKETAKTLGMELRMRPDPIYSNEEADAWVAEAKDKKPDGIILLVLDRQKHSWPTAYKVADTGIPSIIFAPLGCAFHQNTAPLADKPGCVVYSTTLEDSDQMLYGMKMLEAGTKMGHSRCISISGESHGESVMGDTGITVEHLPLQRYIDEVNNISTNDDVISMTHDLMRRAHRCLGPTQEDVLNGIKGYFAARRILEQENGDSITLGGCVDLVKYRPCIAWVTLSDEGIPSACENDLNAIASKTMVQYLFNRPGFQQDPVPDTANRAFIGAHCQCATRLNGFDQPSESFNLSHHHGKTDATVVPVWKENQRVTAIDVSTKKEGQTEICLFTGTVMDNINVPPNGGCVVSVRYKIDGIDTSQAVLSAPGFHQVFFYGDYGREIEDFCKLYNYKLLKQTS